MNETDSDNDTHHLIVASIWKGFLIKLVKQHHGQICQSPFLFKKNQSSLN